MTPKPHHTDASACRAEGGPAPAAPPRYTSEALFRGAATLEIEHQGERYTLRGTRQGKLLLTK